MPPIPRRSVPALVVPTLDAGIFDLASVVPWTSVIPKTMTLVVFYRGLHCPICASYLKDLSRRQAEFFSRGVDVIAISSDTKDRAQAMAEKVGSSTLRFGYGLLLAVARTWGLAISTSSGLTSIGIEEPPFFSEPGVFLIKADGTLYYQSVQSMPFVRPHFSEMIDALDFVIKTDYPARGEYTGRIPRFALSG